MYKLFFKRLIDIVASLGTALILLPFLIIVALIIWLQDFGPIFFTHKRVGKAGNEFNFIKFRSMPVNTPNVESHETEKLQITPFGKFIRRTNLDEIPQLINIIKGDMSLIGPRPPIPTQKELLKMRKENGALAIRPGLTGLAQINSYNNMPDEEKAEWDGKYAKKITFTRDTKIVLRTLLYLTKEPPTY